MGDFYNKEEPNGFVIFLITLFVVRDILAM